MEEKSNMNAILSQTLNEILKQVSKDTESISGDEIVQFLHDFTYVEEKMSE